MFPNSNGSPRAKSHPHKPVVTCGFGAPTKSPHNGTFDPRVATPRTPTLAGMTYVIGSACVDVKDKSCVQECPADCIYEGARSLYINPNECVECAACEFICKVDAIYFEDDLPEDQKQFLEDNARFFTEPLPGRAMFAVKFEMM